MDKQKTVQTSAQLDVLTRPDGSVQFCEGETTVIAGLYGPVEAKNSKALTEKAYIEAHFRPKIGHPGVKDRLVESIIKNVSEAAIAVAFYPRASVVIVVQELQNTGQLLSCALNAVCLAALNARIDMKFMFGAVTCLLDSQGALSFTPPIDPANLAATFTFVFDSAEKNILGCHTEGSFSVEKYLEALELSKAESSNVFDFFKNCLAIK